MYNGGTFDGNRVTDVEDLAEGDALRVDAVPPPAPILGPSISEVLPRNSTGELPSIHYSELTEQIQIGGGAFGDVYRARFHGAAVALKKSAARSSNRASLEKERRLISSVPPHPNVVRVLGVCEDAPDGQAVIVMELCPGGNLKEFFESLPKVRMFTMRNVIFSMIFGTAG